MWVLESGLGCGLKGVRFRVRLQAELETRSYESRNRFHEISNMSLVWNVWQDSNTHPQYVTKRPKLHDFSRSPTHAPQKPSEPKIYNTLTTKDIERLDVAMRTLNSTLVDHIEPRLGK